MPPTTRDPAVSSGGASSLAALPPSSAGSLEGLKSGVDSLLLQLEEEKHQLQLQVDSLRRECDVWRMSFLDLDSERDLWRHQLENIESQITRLASDGTPKTMLVRADNDTPFGNLDGREAKDETEDTYTLALMDAETVCFSRSLLKKGREGGERAASLLTDALATGWETSGGAKQNRRSLVAFVLVDRFELGRFIMAEGVLDSWTTLDEFVLGFNGAASGVLSLVDTARDDVPRKLSSHIKHYAADATCARVVLASSEINRYKRLLLALKSKAVFVAGCDPAKTEGFSLIPVPGLFSRGLSAKRAGEEVYRPVTPTSAINSPGLPDGHHFSQQALDDCRSSSPGFLRGSSSTSVPRSLDANRPTLPASRRAIPQAQESWTTVVSKSKSKPLKPAAAAVPASAVKPSVPALPAGARAPTSGRTSSGKRSISCGSKGEAVGTGERQPGDLGAWERAQWAEYKRGQTEEELEAYKYIKSLNPRPCHQHYLSGRTCDHIAICTYRHDLTLSHVQLLALASTAKEVLCPSFKWGKCKKPESECLHAHHCPFGNNCPFEGTDNGGCWFPEHITASEDGTSILDEYDTDL